MKISPNTQAILLLTAPLIAGRGERSHDLLTLGEYKRLARLLRDTKREPADLLATDCASVMESCGEVVDRERLERLLARGFQMSQALERWQTRAIWVVSRADPDYPRRIKQRLKEDAPPVLYGCGAPPTDARTFAIVGSRNADDGLLDYTGSVARLAAAAGWSVVSGGARGIDQAAMRGALDSGASVIGVLAEDLERAAMNRDHRSALLDRRLLLLSPYDPGAGFNVGHAMQRNKLIYALADAALVVNADLEKGGTWAGAIEQLEQLRFCPIFVRRDEKPGSGLAALRRKGATPWPDPGSPGAFSEALAGAPQTPANGSGGQGELAFRSSEEPPR